MYIIVRKEDNIIIGTANNPVNTKNEHKNGHLIYEIENSEFSKDMIGSKLEGFDEII